MNSYAHHISTAMAESRQREMQAAAEQSRLVREAREAARAARAAREAAEPAARPQPVARRRWRLGLAGMFGAN